MGKQSEQTFVEWDRHFKYISLNPHTNLEVGIFITILQVNKSKRSLPQVIQLVKPSLRLKAVVKAPHLADCPSCCLLCCMMTFQCHPLGSIYLLAKCIDIVHSTSTLWLCAVVQQTTGIAFYFLYLGVQNDLE